jgi:hypothetical protein
VANLCHQCAVVQAGLTRNTPRSKRRNRSPPEYLDQVDASAKGPPLGSHEVRRLVPGRAALSSSKDNLFAYHFPYCSSRFAARPHLRPSAPRRNLAMAVAEATWSSRGRRIGSVLRRDCETRMSLLTAGSCDELRRLLQARCIDERRSMVRLRMVLRDGISRSDEITRQNCVSIQS